jgi:hypothetical protein
MVLVDSLVAEATWEPSSNRAEGEGYEKVNSAKNGTRWNMYQRKLRAAVNALKENLTKTR